MWSVQRGKKIDGQTSHSMWCKQWHFGFDNFLCFLL